MPVKHLLQLEMRLSYMFYRKYINGYKAEKLQKETIEENKSTQTAFIIQ